MNIMYRNRIEINNDPQRRCYNGCHFSTELRWTEWNVLEIGIPEEKVESRLTFWRELNDYAVSQRGENARSEFKIVAEFDNSQPRIYSQNETSTRSNTDGR